MKSRIRTQRSRGGGKGEAGRRIGAAGKGVKKEEEWRNEE